MILCLDKLRKFYHFFLISKNFDLQLNFRFLKVSASIWIATAPGNAATDIGLIGTSLRQNPA